MQCSAKETPVLQANVDNEVKDYNVVPGAWKEVYNWPEMDQSPAGINSAIADAKQQKEHFKA